MLKLLPSQTACEIIDYPFPAHPDQRKGARYLREVKNHSVNTGFLIQNKHSTNEILNIEEITAHCSTIQYRPIIL